MNQNMATMNAMQLVRRNNPQQRLNALNRIGPLGINDQSASGSSSYGILTRMTGLFGSPSTDLIGSDSEHYEKCDNGISLGLLLTALAALAVMFYTLYTKVKNTFSILDKTIVYGFIVSKYQIGKLLFLQKEMYLFIYLHSLKCYKNRLQWL